MQNLNAWKPLFLCKGRGSVVEPSRRPKLQRDGEYPSALVEENGSGIKSSQILQGTNGDDETVASASSLSTTSSSHLDAQIEFLKATAQAAADVVFNTHHDIPDLDESYAKFKTLYPKFLGTEKVEELRLDEYYHLGQHQSRKLGEGFESVNWMAEIARNKGAKVRSACFRWPTLRPCSGELKKELKHKKGRRKDSAVGMFVFPFQSRVTGAKYSSQWMALAQQNGWHVLLDAGALGPKDMDSLGLSLFRPDFIITSFYKVFGEDPTGFGCLFIKNSVIECLESQDGVSVAGLVSIVPSYSPDYLNEPADEQSSKKSDAGEDEIETGFQPHPGLELPAFSGLFTSSQVRDVCASEVDSSFRDGASEDIDNASTLKSPNYSEDENDHLFCIDLGQSPPVSGPLRKGDSGIFTHKTTHRDLLARSHRSPLFYEGNGESSAMPPVAPFSPEVDLSKDGAERPTSSAEICHPLHEAGTDLSLPNHHTNGKCNKIEFLDPGDSPSNGQEKVQCNGFTSGHGLSGGLNLVSEDDRVSSGRIGGSWRFSKQSKLSFILENEEAERDETTPKQGQFTTESTSEETTTYNEIEDTENPGKQVISIASPSVQNGSAHIQNGSAHIQNGHVLKVGNRVNGVMNGSPQPCRTKENAIRRETEGEFRLLGRRDAGRLLDLGTIDRVDSLGRRVSFSMEEEGKQGYFIEENGTANHHDDEGFSDAELAQGYEWNNRESKFLCKHLDHIDSMGLNKITLRLRYLINWLVTSLLQLRHPGPDGGVALVHIYGPKIKYDRGAAVAFNLYDCKGVLIGPEIVQKLADKNNIALGLGFLSHLRLIENGVELQDALDADDISLCKSLVNSSRWEGKRVSLQVEVVTASLGFLSNFEDVYRMWAFVAKFLDVEFSEEHAYQYPSELAQ
ncbi:hypothetical protein SUGI_0059330 [Cryptomeria japonica]|nr:hypothetical protein SUGI_0059330 [Cryptomeria japonica]